MLPLRQRPRLRSLLFPFTLREVAQPLQAEDLQALVATRPESRLGLIVNSFSAQHSFIVLLPQLEKYDITSARHAGVVDGRASFDCYSLPDTPAAELAARAAEVRGYLNER